ncbi:DNA-binding transcriptional LysR family regulator [Methylobacterium sp. RAS18]|nr:DNA-binding transcriptional LysR family regulator [Methylobacterium sp. RAS18]
MDRIDLYRLFAQIVDSASFSRAADVTGVSRSTVSVAVQELEARLGVRLLNRTTRRVVPTQEGLAFYDRCRRVLDDVEDAEGLFQVARSPTGRLRVDLPVRMARLIVAARLPEFLARHPGIDVALGVTDRAIDLLDEGADCVLRVGAAIDNGMLVRDLGLLPIVTAASPAYLTAHGTPRTPGDLNDHRAVNYASPTTGRIEPFEWTVGGEVHSRMLPGRVSANGADMYIACGLVGLGLIQVPLYDVQGHLASGELIEVLPDHRAAPMAMSLIFPQRRHVPRRVQVFADWLADLITEATGLSA